MHNAKRSLLMNESDFPALYVAADIASKSVQTYFFRALGFNLAALVIAASLSVLNYPSAWFSIPQAATLLVSLSLAIYLAHRQPQRIWYSTRALSESIKTVAWRFMMRAEPYDIGEAAAKAHFLRGLHKILDANKQVCAHAVGMMSADQITPKMLEIRALPLVKRKQFYAVERIEDQYEWYRKKAKVNRSHSSRWFWALITVNSIAVLFALVKIKMPNQSMSPTDIFVTAAGAIM